MEAFTIRNLSFSYPGQKRNAVDSVSLTVEQGAFLVLCGPSGSGKSTLLRQLKPSLTPHGPRKGQILFEGTPLEELDQRAQSQKIGFVQQSPENQIVTDKVWHELAFGLESLGYDTPAIRRRTAEMAAFFGIEDWFYKDVAALSGGQKQLLNLASVMATSPSVLILDEPTSRLDPIAASEFLAVLGRINRELGTTVILTEHRLEEAFPLASAAAVMDHGRLLCTGTPKDVGLLLKDMGHAMFPAMPAAMRVWAAVEHDAPCPVTVRDGRGWLADYAAGHTLNALPAERESPPPDENAIRAEGLWFRYGQDAPDVVKGMELRVKRGEFFALLGGNGTGKTTTLKLLAGLLAPYRGSVHACGRIGVLPQDPQTLFVKKTVREDLFDIFNGRELPRSERETAVANIVRLCRLEELLDRHPYDLSGGEQQRAALAKVLLPAPDILLLDEPTKGLDADFRQILAEIMQVLLRRGVTVFMVSHDVEFCARYAHTCALFFDGSIVTQAPPRAFFSGNQFYTTAVNRMARELVPEAVTVEDLIAVCGGAPPPAPDLPEDDFILPQTAKNAGQEASPAEMPAERRKLDRRTLAAAALILLLIPLTLFVGETYLAGRKYTFIALLILLECTAPFVFVFERRKPKARELAVIAVLCAIGVAGRAAFFMLPQFKPVLALSILAGVAFGGETGFLVGAMTMLVSNMLFSQGPWTPWQMFSMGIIGFLAGVLFRKGWLRRSRVSLCIFGALSAIVIYGGIMNPASALMWAGELNPEILLSYYITGFPMDCVHAAATWLFLWFAAEPMLEKLERVRTKYGLLE